MADPGFFRGGCANSQIWIILPILPICQKLHENERISTPGGFPGASLSSASTQCSRTLEPNMYHFFEGNMLNQWRIYIVKFWTRPTPRGPNSFNFTSFWDNLVKSYVATPWRVGAPTSGKSWIRHCKLQFPKNVGSKR